MNTKADYWIRGTIYKNSVTKVMYKSDTFVYNYIIEYKDHLNQDKKINVYSFKEPYISSTVQFYKFRINVESKYKDDLQKYITTVEVTDCNPVFIGQNISEDSFFDTETVSISKNEYEHLIKLCDYVDNWYPNYYECCECGAYNPEGYICCKCGTDNSYKE